MDTTYIVKSKITKFDFFEEKPLKEELSRELTTKYTKDDILTLPHYLLMKDDKLYWKAKIKISLEKDESVTKYFESNEKAIQFIIFKLDIKTIEI